MYMYMHMYMQIFDVYDNLNELFRRGNGIYNRLDMRYGNIITPAVWPFQWNWMIKYRIFVFRPPCGKSSNRQNHGPLFFNFRRCARMVDQKGLLHSKWVCLRPPQNLFFHLICPTVKLLEYPIILPHLKTDSSIQVDIRSSVSVSFRWVWGSFFCPEMGVYPFFSTGKRMISRYIHYISYIHYRAPDFYPWLGGFEASELQINCRPTSMPNVNVHVTLYI